MMITNYTDGLIDVEGILLEVRCVEPGWSELSLADPWYSSDAKNIPLNEEFSNDKTITVRTNLESDARVDKTS